MNKFTYTFQTPDHSYDIVPDLLQEDTVRVQSEFKDSVEEFLNTLELAGLADDRDNPIDFSHLTVEQDSNSYDTYYFIEITKSDLALYFRFEVLNFMGPVFEP